MRTLLVPVAIATVATLTLTAPGARAQECGVSLDMYEDAPLVADLHPKDTLDALERGDNASAAILAREALNDARVNVRQLQVALKNPRRVKGGTAFGEDDIRAALAAAIVRSNGVEGLREPTRNPKQQKRNLQQAEALLKVQARIHAGDPVVTTYLAEALVAVGKRDEARAILEDLAAADLIVSAEGWAALAAVTDGDASAQARTRCAAMARDAATCVDRVDPATLVASTASAPRS